MILIVQTADFTATARWQKIYGIWSCTWASPSLHWMIGMNTAQAHVALLKMQANFSWDYPTKPVDDPPIMAAKSPARLDPEEGTVRLQASAHPGHSAPAKPQATPTRALPESPAAHQTCPR